MKCVIIMTIIIPVVTLIVSEQLEGSPSFQVSDQKRKYAYLAISHLNNYFVKNHSDYTHNY